jgi:hypothetical protein
MGVKDQWERSPSVIGASVMGVVSILVLDFVSARISWADAR